MVTTLIAAIIIQIVILGRIRLAASDAYIYVIASVVGLIVTVALYFFGLLDILFGRLGRRKGGFLS